MLKNDSWSCLTMNIASKCHALAWNQTAYHQCSQILVFQALWLFQKLSLHAQEALNLFSRLFLQHHLCFWSCWVWCWCSSLQGWFCSVKSGEEDRQQALQNVKIRHPIQILGLVVSCNVPSVHLFPQFSFDFDCFADIKTSSDSSFQGVFGPATSICCVKKVSL